MPVATGSTFTFTGWRGKATNIAWSGASVELYDDSNFQSLVKEWEAKDLADLGKVTLSAKWRTGLTLPGLRSKALLTIVAPSGAPGIAGYAIYTGITNVKLANEEDMTADLEFQFTSQTMGAGAPGGLGGMTISTGAKNV